MVRAGERVTVSVPAAHHDATVHERLDFEREPFAHLAFGHGRLRYGVAELPVGWRRGGR